MTVFLPIWLLHSGVAKGGAVRPRRRFYRGSTTGYAVGYKPVQGLLKWVVLLSGHYSQLKVVFDFE